MKQLVLVLLLLCPVFCKKENLDELSSLLNDPKLLFELRKRFGNLLDDVIEDENVGKPEVGCYSLSDTLNGNCAFHTNGSTIIKTTESMGNGAKFLANLANVSCPRNCTAACCENKECDTAVFQDKKEHNCYLFQCGHPSKCVFVGHEDFWMSSISKDVHETHKFTPGGATPSHENELENLGTPEPSDEIIHTTVLPDVITTKAPRPEKVPVTSIPRKPGLGQPCPSYKTKCEDPHAGCRGNICRCNVGYHQKHGVCRTHCPIGDFECENIGYGSKVVQCVPGSAVCDGNQDCEDWSDEYNCTTDNEGKTAYQDTDLSGSLYNSPLYNLPYGNPPDAQQYPYGFPIPGLANPQQAGILPPNQIYPSQIQPNGQYYYPNLANQNILPPPSNPLSPQQWPFLDKNVGIGSQAYGTPNQGYQTGHQAGYLSPQTGNYGPVVQNPVKTPIQISPNIQPVQVLPNQNVKPVVQQVNPVAVNPVTTVPAADSQQVNKGPKIAQERGQDHNEMNKAPVLDASTSAPAITKERFNSGADFGKTDDTVDSRNDYYDEATVSHRHPSLSLFNDNVPDIDSGTANQHAVNGVRNDGKETGRHSADIDDDVYHKPKTFPPATKTKTQIGTPTQSTAAGQRHSQSHAEGLPDYSWVKYDSDKPRVSGKKGGSAHSNQGDGSTEIKPKTRVKPQDNEDNSRNRKPALSNHISKQGNSNRLVPSTKYDDRTSEVNFDYESDRYPVRYKDNYAKAGSNRRPSYDRYRDRFSDNRRRPGHGSRYPYYDTGYGRGRDRNPYPVWDKFREDYYYPDNFDANRVDDDDVDLKEDMSYDDIADTITPKPVHVLGNKEDQTGVKPTKAPSTAVPVIPTSTAGHIEEVPVTTNKPAITKSTVVSDQVSKEKEPSESNQAEDTKQNGLLENEGKTVADSADESENNKSTESTQDTDSNDEKPFRILNADKIEVDTYTDSSQGPIVALALGLAITMMLLIFVGCRLRTVKRRLRKGRALHSNEADYLINGMYL